ncbi:MAG: membrane dipeptidase [Pirellulales bacterium]
MNRNTARPIIDSHLDLAWNALSFNRDQTEPLSTLNEREAPMDDLPARGRATTCLPEMRRGAIGVCLATILCRAKRHVQPAAGHARTDLDYGTQEIAYGIGQGQLAYYRAMERRGLMRMIGTADDLEQHWRAWVDSDGAEDTPLGYILAMEGADPIIDPAQAADWWDDGLRSVMLAHYGTSHYAVGTGESGPVSPRGIELLREFQQLGMILDVTHLCDESFFQALDHFSGPVMASHTNCRALVPGDRQFSDEQIHLLIERGAVIGAVLDAWMLRPGWKRGKSRPEGLTLAAVADHVDHVCQLAGNCRHAALGSDLDGGFGTEQTPEDVRSIADLQNLAPILLDRGYSQSDMDAIFHGNWLRYFREHLPRG